MGGSLSTVSGTAEGFTVCAMTETVLEIRTLLFSPQENRVIVLIDTLFRTCTEMRFLFRLESFKLADKR